MAITYPLCPGEQRQTLLQAFEQGSQAARSASDIGRCPYSATRDPDTFLAWLAGFKCCSVN